MECLGFEKFSKLLLLHPLLVEKNLQDTNTGEEMHNQCSAAQHKYSNPVSQQDGIKIRIVCLMAV